MAINWLISLLNILLAVYTFIIAYKAFNSIRESHRGERCAVISLYLSVIIGIMNLLYLVKPIIEVHSLQFLAIRFLTDTTVLIYLILSSKRIYLRQKREINTHATIKKAQVH